MSRPATDRLKLNPPLGNLPALQYLLPQQLQVDQAYQRSLDSDKSKTLIRRIAQHWNWDLCQPLVVARRDDGALFVIDGQHRLEAARLRADIAQLPAVVVQYASRADEAASFVHLNAERAALKKIDLFKAAVASGDTEATAIVAALEAAGLSAAPHSNFTSWKPGMLSNIGGIEAAWRQHGPTVAALALKAMGEALAGQVLRYAGTIFPGIVAVVARETEGGANPFWEWRWPQFVGMIGESQQEAWRRDILNLRADQPNLNVWRASAAVFLGVWEKRKGQRSDPSPPPPSAPPPPPPTLALPLHAVKPEVQVKAPPGPTWCEQCEQRVSADCASRCTWAKCGMRKAA